MFIVMKVWTQNLTLNYLGILNKLHILFQSPLIFKWGTIISNKHYESKTSCIVRNTIYSINSKPKSSKEILSMLWMILPWCLSLPGPSFPNKFNYQKTDYRWLFICKNLALGTYWHWIKRQKLLIHCLGYSWLSQLTFCLDSHGSFTYIS